MISLPLYRKKRVKSKRFSVRSGEKAAHIYDSPPLSPCQTTFSPPQGQPPVRTTLSISPYSPRGSSMSPKLLKVEPGFSQQVTYRVFPSWS